MKPHHMGMGAQVLALRLAQVMSWSPSPFSLACSLERAVSRWLPDFSEKTQHNVVLPTVLFGFRQPGPGGTKRIEA